MAALAVTMFLSGAVAAQEAAKPRAIRLPFERIRTADKKIEVYTFFLTSEDGKPFEVRFRGVMSYDTSDLTVTVTSPQGKTIVDKTSAVAKGDIALNVAVPAEGEKGKYKVRISGSGGGWEIVSTTAAEPALKMTLPLTSRLYYLRKGGSLYLGVPKGATGVKVSILSGSKEPATLTFLDGAGAEVRKLNLQGEAKVQEVLPVAPGKDGCVWRCDIGPGFSATMDITVLGADADIVGAVAPQTLESAN
jgi:hypothetical protein